MSIKNLHGDTPQSFESVEENQSPAKRLTPEARRALAEAEDRRKAEVEAETRPYEDGGPAGLEPTRYGDWERKGIVSDF